MDCTNEQKNEDESEKWLILLSYLIAEQETETRNQLLALQEELQYKNRFFPDNKILKQIDAFVEGPYTILPVGTTLYRSRVISKVDEPIFLNTLRDDINNLFKISDFDISNGEAQLLKLIPYLYFNQRDEIVSDDDYQKLLDKYSSNAWWGYSEKESDAPPKGITKAGRINPKGISYLYASGDIRTSALEVRPVISQFVSVAEIKVEKDIRLFDFIANYGQDELKNHSIDSINLSVLSEYFSQPNYGENDLYLATQYISEYIKNIHDDNGTKCFDGLCFRSSLNNDGLNYVLFDTSDNRKYRVCNSKLYKMIDLNGTLEQWLPIDEDNNIIERKLMQLTDSNVSCVQGKTND